MMSNEDFKDMVNSKKLQLIHDSIGFRLRSIKSYHEVFLMQIPKSLNPQLLEDSEILVDGEVKIQLGNEKYMCTTEPCKGKSINLVGDLDNEEVGLKVLKPKGVIKVHKYLKSSHKSEIPALYDDRVQFPDDLKIRHPLLGSDWKKELKRRKDIAKIRKTYEVDQCDELINISQIKQEVEDDVSFSKKKKKKRKQ